MTGEECYCPKFKGQLFKGNTQDKTWSLLCEGSVTMETRPPEGVERGVAWHLVATREDEIVWECRMEPGLKHRVKDSFLQWQMKRSEGLVTFGLRLKSAELAQQLSDAITLALTSSAFKQSRKPSINSDSCVSLKIIPPMGQPFSLSLPQLTTITQVMAIIAERRKINPAHYNLSLPPEDPKGEGVACFGSMPVNRLKTDVLHLRWRDGVPPSEEQSSPIDPNLVTVVLPKGEKTVIKVTPQTTLPELLQLVCRKRSLDPAHFVFDLPATEASLVGKTLSQLRLNSVHLVPKETMPSGGASSRKSSSVKHTHKVKNNHTSSVSPKGLSRRQAPPPPQQLRRTAPGLVRELEAEVAGKRRGREEGEVRRRRWGVES